MPVQTRNTRVKYLPFLNLTMFLVKFFQLMKKLPVEKQNEPVSINPSNCKTKTKSSLNNFSSDWCNKMRSLSNAFHNR